MLINPKVLYKILEQSDIHFFTGVPDSTLKDFCFYLDDHISESKHVIAANEGNSIAIAAGYYLSTGRIPLVYMQNSGLGNAINPFTSLVDRTVFDIPMLVMMGWRGEPGKKDAIQHLKDGQIQLSLLDSLGLSYTIIPSENQNLESQIRDSVNGIRKSGNQHILLVRKNSFETYTSITTSPRISVGMSREDAISESIKFIEKDAIVVSTTGKASRELYESRKKDNKYKNGDLMIVGSMGHASSVSLGIALQEKKRKIYCIDGDGSLIMHMGALSTIGKYSSVNFKHIIINNFSHDSVGGQATSSDSIDFSSLSKAVSYKNYFKISNKDDFSHIFQLFQSSVGPSMLEIIVDKGSRDNLSRPDLSPQENKKRFMNFLGL